LRDRDAERVGAQPLLGHLERRPRPGARLEEEIDDGAASQRRDLLDGTRGDLLHRLRGVEDERDFLGLEVGDAEQVTRLQHYEASPCKSTSSSPSISWRRTWTLCFGEVGRFLPT